MSEEPSPHDVMMFQVGMLLTVVMVTATLPCVDLNVAKIFGVKFTVVGQFNLIQNGDLFWPLSIYFLAEQISY